jgi:hypothetical protein
LPEQADTIREKQRMIKTKRNDFKGTPHYWTNNVV